MNVVCFFFPYVLRVSGTVLYLVYAEMSPKGRTAHPRCLARYFSPGVDHNINSLQQEKSPQPTFFLERFDLISYSYSKRLIKR